MECLQRIRVVSVVVGLSMAFTSSAIRAMTRTEMNREGRAALNHIDSISRTACNLGKSARAVLVFPSIVKTGANGARGYGTLFAHDRAIGYYKLVAGPRGMPKGVQKFGYALFFMSDEAVAALRDSGAWDVSAGPNAVVIITPSAAHIVPHATQITHRPAMNDQQEAAPRPNDLTLDPAYRGFVPFPHTRRTTKPSAGRGQDRVYAFAFGRRGLIRGISLQGTSVTAIHPH
jgi:lipid-binding SYLF domain-containing protein